MKSTDYTDDTDCSEGRGTKDRPGQSGTEERKWWERAADFLAERERRVQSAESRVQSCGGTKDKGRTGTIGDDAWVHGVEKREREERQMEITEPEKSEARNQKPECRIGKGRGVGRGESGG